ncbi:hypothetical protein FACS1894164_16810 [Spirochaetia bacterium]|nr:hypothetical protein FACS1894164_16810 [Spirochaetia bacterium]
MKQKLLLVWVAIVLIPAALSAQQKYALVIGNGDYTNVGRLNNPVNDANDMAATLTGLGFQVEKVLNGNRKQMNDGVRLLARRLSQSHSSYGFFFYAGHGVQYNGENYLIPVDADIQSRADLPYETLNVQQTLDLLQEAENELNIIVLDACRDFPSSWNRGGSRGLSVVTGQPSDSIIVYATSAGSVAQDGTGRNGLFTGELLKHLPTPGIDVAEVFRRTGADVQRASNREQIPAVYNQFFGTAYLGGSAPPAPQPVVTPQVPRNVRAGTPGTDSVTLNWDSAGVGISYRVYYNTQNNASGATALDDSTTGTSFNITGMATNSTYYFWVSSLQNGRESAKSPAVTVRTASAPVPVQPSIPANFARIPGGTFTMGSPASEVDRYDNEVQHRVTITGFSMSKYEVTQKEYQEVMGTNPSYLKGDSLPVENVSWYDAIEYCNARSRKERLTPVYTIDKSRKDPNNSNDYDDLKWVVTWNRSANGYRLPTEAEWEYACRAGTTTPFSTGTNITTNQANYDGNYPYNGNAKGSYRRQTWAVGSGTANSWGLYDMHGNVYEWCWDWHGNYSTASQTDPTGAASGTYRVLRGGSWIYYARLLRSASRNRNTPTDRDSNNGFRVVLP